MLNNSKKHGFLFGCWAFPFFNLSYSWLWQPWLY